jgi:hypothetical protein
MGIAMTIRALVIPETVPHDPVTASQTLFRVTGHALELFVCAFERVACQLCMIESFDLESRGDVTRIALALGRGESKLPGVHIAVAPGALTRRPTVRSPLPAQAVLFRRAVTAVARCLRVRASKGPNTMVDARRIPTARGVAMGAAVLAHLRCELIPVRVLVAIDASLGLELEVEVGAFALMTTRAGDRLMFAIERERRSVVLLHGKQGRPKPLLVVARLAVGASEAPTVHVSMAVCALIELETTIPSLNRKLGRVTALAGDSPVQPLERKDRERMGAQPDLLRQSGPTDAGMTVLASITKLRFVHLRVAGNALRARARSFGVPLVVTDFTLRFRVAPCEAQTWMIRLDVGDLAPVGLVVARSAFRPGKPSCMWIFVAGHALSLQP